MHERYVCKATDNELDKIRASFLEKYKSKLEKNEYHSKDLERINKNNEWIKAFYKHGLDDVNKAVDLIDEVLTWRKKFGANANPNVIIKVHFCVKTHKKDRYPHDQICKLIAYFLEKEYKFNVDNPIVLMFDMTDAGYSNMDIEMTKFNTYCLKSYYAGLIAIWKLVKALLPAKAVDLVKFVDKKSILDYVDQDQLFIHMGGTDKFEYSPDEPDLYIQIENGKLELQ